MSFSSSRGSRRRSSFADFVDITPQSGSRRSSNFITSPVQHLVDEWEGRDCPVMSVAHMPPHLLAIGAAQPVSYIDLGGVGPKEVFSVVLPWMHLGVCCGNETSLLDMKHAIFSNIKRMIHPNFSSNAEDYVFRITMISHQTDMPMFADLFFEEQLLRNVEMTPTFPLFFLYEPEGFRTDKDISRAIGNALGVPLYHLEPTLSEELRECRLKFFSEVEIAVRARTRGGTGHYAFPEDDIVTQEPVCSQGLLNKIFENKLTYRVAYWSAEDEKAMNTASAQEVAIDFVETFTTPKLIEAALLKIAKECEKAANFLLQVAGEKCFLSKNIPLMQYRSVRSTFEDFRCPLLVLRRKNFVFQDYLSPSTDLHRPAYVRVGQAEAAVSETFQPISLWELDANLTVRPISCSNMGSSESDSLIRINFAVFIGNVMLGQARSQSVPIHNPRWTGDFIDFQLYMKDLPPSTFISMTLIEEVAEKRKSNGYEDKILGWLNLPLFDWKRELIQGAHSFPLRTEPFRTNNGSVFNTDGLIGQLDSKGTLRVMVELANWQTKVKLPDYDEYSDFVQTQRKWGNIPHPVNIEDEAKSTERIEHLLRLHNNGGKLTREDELFIWDHRHFIGEAVPDALVLLVDTCEMWRSREAFGEMFAMLSEWSQLSIGTCLLLLSRNHLDFTVRKFVVDHLNDALTSSTFHHFILPLVQALKNETHACSALAILLIRKALLDYRIGHKLFWILRAELADEKKKGMNLEKGERLSEGFKLLCLILEAYLRGNESQIRMIMKQVGMVDRLSMLSNRLKAQPNIAATKILQEELKTWSVHFEHLDSPLDPRNSLGELVIERCRVMSSAKQPFLLCWRNASIMAPPAKPYYEILYKCGDDLRQDMLVLQVLQIMDSIWKQSGLHCYISPYPILPMGMKIGMIGVIQDCKTIFNIQSDGGKVNTAVKSLETTFLHKYLRSLHTDNHDYKLCVDRFAMSCVGYSVATYIMGIKDRHHDNIMMTSSGRLFHIDFGHILGHGKTKLGIQRDRTPFVLTEHFLCVISTGEKVQRMSPAVERFRKLCIEAYLLLWDQRDLFVSLFSIMQAMQLPELCTSQDLEYLKKAICYDANSRELAENHFNEVFTEAFNGSWSTKTNWFFHSVKHL